MNAFSVKKGIIWIQLQKTALNVIKTVKLAFSMTKIVPHVNWESIWIIQFVKLVKWIIVQYVMEVVVINVILDIFLILNNNALIVYIIAKYVVMLPPVSYVMMVIILTVTKNA